MTPEILPLAILSERTGIAVSTLRDWASTGRLPGTRKVGGHWLANWEVFARWVGEGNLEEANGRY